MPHLAGGGRLLPASSNAENTPPQHALDVCLLAAVFPKVKRNLDVQAMQGKVPPRLWTWYRHLKRERLDLARNPWRTLSPNMRAACEKWMRPEELQKLRSRVIDDSVPEVLRHLPLKPPRRPPSDL